jgi:hypothetical protein
MIPRLREPRLATARITFRRARFIKNIRRANFTPAHPE